LFIAPTDDLTTEQARYLAALHDAQPVLSTAYALAQGFMGLLRERRGHELDAWIAQATASDCAAIRSFATGLLPDKAAVTAGLTEAWSTGPCEGHIHKTKLIKRSMYGKASFPLLRRRVLGAVVDLPTEHTHTQGAQGAVLLKAA
jgi:transposase